MKTRQLPKAFLLVSLLAALLFPLGAGAQVEEARVRIDGMV